MSFSFSINFAAMARFKGIALFIVMLSVLLPASSFSQDEEMNRHPIAVLVQLKAERNRYNALVKAKRFNDVEALIRDRNGAAYAMINDFKDHFDACHVYYYSDTNFDAVMARKFDGVLLNADLSPATDIIISDTSRNYLIVYYGYPGWQTKTYKWDTTRATDMGGRPNGRGLIINDYKMRQLGYLYWLDYDFFNFRRKGKKNIYRYSSKKFDIDYSPCASEFNRNVYKSTGR